MSYNYSKGRQVIGDLSGSDDSGRDTGIDFEDDYIGFQTSGSARMVVSGSKVGIGTTTPDYTLDVAGDIGVNQYIYHNGDANTWINFSDNRIRLNAGGNNFIDCEDPGSAPHKVRINNGGNNIDFVIKDNSGNVYFTADASTTRVGIGTDTPDELLHVSGNIKASGDDARIKINGDTDSHPGLELYENGTRKWIIYNDYGNDNLTFKTNSNTRMSIEQDGDVGIGTTSPIAKLDVAGKIAITAESSTPSQPSDGQGYLYSKSDGKIYWRSYDLSETDLTATGGDPVETLNNLTGATGDVNHDCTNSNFFYHTNISGNFTPNFTELNMQNDQITEAGLILTQGGTGYLPSAFKVNNTGSAIYWEGAAMPTASTNGTDTVDLKITRVSNNYNVFARFSTTIYVAAQGGGSGVTIPNNCLCFLDASDTNSYNGSGTTWADISGQGKDATLVNTPSFSDSDKWFDFTAGSSHHVTLPSGFADFTSGATFFFVADLESGNNWERLLDFSGGSSTPINVGRKQSGTTMKLEYYNPSKTGTETNMILNNTLASYSVTTDGVNAKFYRNGTLVATNSFDKVPDNNTRTQNYIGRSRSASDSYYDGKIAVVAIFNRDLSSSEISDLHNHYDTIYSL